MSNVNRLYEMTVRYVRYCFRNIPLMETEIHLKKGFDLHEHSL